MTLFKRRWFALLLTLILILASTLLSVHMKLGREAQKPSVSFCASHLKNIAAYADGLVTIARNYELDTGDVEDSSEWLKLALNYSEGDIPYIHYTYQELLKAVTTLEDQLSRTQLSERDASGVRQYSDSITGARSAIEGSGYNESVREFLRKNSNWAGKNEI